MAKYTAVQYLIQQINNVFGHDRITVDQALQLMNVAKDAERMEKDQIAQAWDLGRRDVDYPADGNAYYNETYEK